MSVLDTADTIRARYERAAPSSTRRASACSVRLGRSPASETLGRSFPTRTPVAGLKRPMAMSSCVTSPPPISGPSPGRSCLGPPMSGPFCGRWIPPPKNTRRLHASSMPKLWSVWGSGKQRLKRRQERKQSEEVTHDSGDQQRRMAHQRRKGPTGPRDGPEKKK